MVLYLTCQYTKYTTDMTEGLGFDVSVFCNRLLLFIPIASSVVAAVISQKRLIQKWATMKTAASQIVAEIYKFRTDVLEYDPYAAAQNLGENVRNFYSVNRMRGTAVSVVGFLCFLFLCFVF